MKNVTVLFVITLVVSVFDCVAQPFQVCSNVFSVGLGLGSSYGFGRFGHQSPALSIQYEHGLVDVPGPGVVSVGGYVGTKGFRNDNSFGGGYWYKESWRYTTIGVRSAYHYNGLDVEPLDVYGGAMLSYNILNYKYSDNDPILNYYDGNYGSRLGFNLYIGGRYFFTPQVAGFAELGYGVSYFTLGAAVKL